MLSDEQLAARAQAGDSLATDALMGRYVGLAYHIARDFYSPVGGSDDVRQEALLGLQGAIRNYRPDCGASFKTLAVICIRRSLMSMVKRDRRGCHEILTAAMSLDVRVPDGDAEDRMLGEALPDPRQPDPADVLAFRATLDALARCLRDDLSPLEREALLGTVNGESHEQTQMRLGRPMPGVGYRGRPRPKSIENAMDRAQRKIRRALDEAA